MPRPDARSPRAGRCGRLSRSGRLWSCSPPVTCFGSFSSSEAGSDEHAAVLGADLQDLVVPAAVFVSAPLHRSLGHWRSPPALRHGPDPPRPIPAVRPQWPRSAMSEPLSDKSATTRPVGGLETPLGPLDHEDRQVSEGTSPETKLGTRWLGVTCSAHWLERCYCWSAIVPVGHRSCAIVADGGRYCLVSGDQNGNLDHDIR